MANRHYCCFKGRGEISLVNYAARIARTAGFKPVGNASVFTLTVAENTENVQDYTSPSGGIACAVREIQTVTANLSLRCHKPENWALATSGTGADAEVETGAIVDEEHVLFPDSVEPLAHLIDDTVAPVVTSVDAEPVTYVAGTDYELTASGSIKHIEGGSIPAPTVTNGIGQPNIRVSYTRRDQTLIQLYSKAPEPVALHFDGFNVAEAIVSATQFDLFKVVFGPAATINVIGDNLAVLELTGTVERDTTRPLGTLANPFSQYGTLKI